MHYKQIKQLHNPWCNDEGIQMINYYTKNNLQTYPSWPTKKLLGDLHSNLTIEGLLPSLNKNYAIVV